MLRNKVKVIIAVLSILSVFYFPSRKVKVLEEEVDKKKLSNYDLILSKGQSVHSRFINLLNCSSSSYTHIGIINKEDDQVYVLHSTPDGTKENGIRYDKLQSFFDLSSVSDYTVLRSQYITDSTREKLRIEFDKYRKSQVPFDFDFNNLESNKIYCSELVWLIYTQAEACDKNQFNFKKPIYPKFFLNLNEFSIVACKKNGL